MSWQSSTVSQRHIPQFGGEIYYVSKSGSNSNPGRHPDEAFLTITYAETQVSNGDAINVKAGTYADEGALEISGDGVELWGEIGALIAPSGATTCLKVSGNSCLIRGIKVQKAAQIGFDIDGAGCVLEDCISQDNSIAYDIDGCCTTLVRCKDIDATTTGYDIATYSNTLYLCSTIATSGTSRGFYLSNAAADANMLYQCSSLGNSVAGFETVSGCTNNMFAFCTSGGGDGVKVDATETNQFPAFHFDNHISNEIDIAQGGGGTWEYNIFKITGTVQINRIAGIVETALTGTNTDCYIDVWSTNGPTNLSKTSTLDIGAAIVGATLMRLDKEDKILAFATAAGAGLMDEIDLKKEGFRVIEDRTGAAHVATYIRFVHDTAGASSGEIDWYVDWEPISHDGFLEAA